MSDNVCPYCGSEVRTNCEYKRGLGVWIVTTFCDTGHGFTFKLNMPADTPIPDVAAIALHAFCHPAHLLEGKALVGDGLRTYDPATHIVVSREAGERVAKIIEYDVCGRENCKCGELAAELRAALEEK